MQLVISNIVTNVSNSSNKGDIILPPLITISFYWRNKTIEVPFEEVEIDGWLMFKRILQFEWVLVKCIGLSQDGDNRIAFVNT